MGKRRVFTKEFKEEACKLVIEEKQKISETARDLGIGQGMLGQWVKALGMPVRIQKQIMSGRE